MNIQETIKRILREEKDTTGDWKKRNGGLTKKYKFSDYDETISFVNKVAKIAKKQNHHPDIKVGYDVVEISITDHAKGGVSEKCYKFIEEVNKIKL